MKFKKTQIKRGNPSHGFFHHAFDSLGSMLFNVPVIVESVEFGELSFKVGTRSDASRWPTLAEAKREAKSCAGY